MKKLRSYYIHLRHPHTTMERKWIYPLVIGSIVSLFLLFLATLTSPDGTPILPLYRYYAGGAPASVFVEHKLRSVPVSALPPPPRLAYLISGSKNDGEMLRRTLLAIYHPNNRYVVHLDAESSPEERMRLSRFVKEHPVFVRFGNVVMITKANLVTYRGPTMVANTLHAAAILLREGGDWDWFINLSASDYPLVTQDDLLHTFSYLPRDLNFLDHTSRIGWKESQRAKPVIVDPGLYMTKKADKCAYCIQIIYRIRLDGPISAVHRLLHLGLGQPPRTVLMYYANFISSPEGYFHTVICNAHEFRNTTVNSDLHFISWDHPPRQHPHYLTTNHMRRMIESNAPFARKFRRDDPVLDRIDSELLSRGPEMIVPGGWCVGSRENGSDPCSVPGNVTLLRPTSGAERVGKLVASLLSERSFRSKQCR
ncbi:hypothetical protein OSB04_000006 [Centaurea solstitialis]|uniref:Uncharacterized protein n=1 Tax=Centaurea solstitialis TaxID=347529 RepID=A0AA38TZZ7_9ASTR|nr:hypothetical protein OSB04_000006 [Centaurea solstitialis]